MKIILASHCKLAEGMKQTAEFFGLFGLESIEQTVQDSGFEKRARELLEKYKSQQIIVFTDIIGGSVNQIFCRLLQDYQFHLISGMNLPMILELGFKEDVDSETLKEIVEKSKQQIVYMNEYLQTVLCDEED